MVGEWSLDMRMQPGPRRTVGKSRLATRLGSLYVLCAPGPSGPAKQQQPPTVLTIRGVELSMPWVTRKDPEGTICLLINFLQLSSWATEASTRNFTAEMIRNHKGESHCLCDLPSGLSSLVPLFASPVAPLFADIRLHWQSLPPRSSRCTSPLPCHHPYRFFLAGSLPLIFHFGLPSGFYYLCLALTHALQRCNFQVEGECGAVLLWVAEGRGRGRKHCGCLAMDTLKPQTIEATYSSRAQDIN